MVTRKAIHAGSWYSDSGSTLDSELTSWLRGADISHAPARAIIAPHAGYTYCGACGAFAYKQVDPKTVRRVFILGPSHHVYLAGCALSSTTHYETPLYNLEIDQMIYRELLSTGQFEQMSQSVDEEEHSIEMHLPYIAKVMKERRDKLTIVPILVGALKQQGEVTYGHLLSKYLADPENLFVISSDFCHWGKRFRYTYYNKSDGPIHASIETLDRTGMARIESLDPLAFSAYLNETQNTICGRHPIAVLLNEYLTTHETPISLLASKNTSMLIQAVDNLRSTRTDLEFSLKFVKYAQSNHCSSLSDSSVSYASGSLTVTQKLAPQTFPVLEPDPHRLTQRRDRSNQSQNQTLT